MSNTDVQETVPEYMTAIMSIVEDASDKWMRIHPKEKLKKELYAVLNKNRTDIIYKLLGFKNDWGKWTVDHPITNSTAAGHLNRIAKDSITSWFEEIDLIPLEDEIKETLIEEYKQRYRTQFRQALWQKIEIKVKKDADRYLDKLSDEINEQINKQIDFKELLKGNPDAN